MPQAEYKLPSNLDLENCEHHFNLLTTQLFEMSKYATFWIIVGTLLCSCESNAAHILPPAEFINEFAHEHDRNFITFYIPENSSVKWLKWHKNSVSM